MKAFCALLLFVIATQAAADAPFVFEISLKDSASRVDAAAGNEAAQLNVARIRDAVVALGTVANGLTTALTPDVVSVLITIDPYASGKNGYKVSNYLCKFNYIFNYITFFNNLQATVTIKSAETTFAELVTLSENIVASDFLATFNLVDGFQAVLPIVWRSILNFYEVYLEISGSAGAEAVLLAKTKAAFVSAGNGLSPPLTAAEVNVRLYSGHSNNTYKVGILVRSKVLNKTKKLMPAFLQIMVSIVSSSTRSIKIAHFLYTPAVQAVAIGATYATGYAMVPGSAVFPYVFTFKLKDVGARVDEGTGYSEAYSNMGAIRAAVVAAGTVANGLSTALDAASVWPFVLLDGTFASGDTKYMVRIRAIYID